MDWQLVIHHSITHLWVATVFVFIVIFFSVIQIVRSQQKYLNIAIESLRLVVVLILLFLLGKPELIKDLPQLIKPEVYILEDKSLSMETIDEDFEGKITKRKNAIKAVRENGVFNQLYQKYDVRELTFNGNENTKDGTDFHYLLTDTLNKGKNLRSIMILSDGDVNLGPDPIGASFKYKDENIPIYSVMVGDTSSLPDIRISDFTPPSYGMIREKVTIPFELVSTYSEDTEVTASMFINNDKVSEKHIYIGAQDRVRESLSWKADESGEFDVEIKVNVPEWDVLSDNNKKRSKLKIKDEMINVLVIESIPRWEYRFLRNALMRDPGVNVNTILFHESGMRVGGGQGYLKKIPESMDELSHYDVFFIGDVSKEMIGDKSMAIIKDMVLNHACGLVFLPGYQGNQLSFVESDFSDLIPVFFDENTMEGHSSMLPSKVRLTPDGEEHLLTLLADTGESNARLWSGLPGFNWYAPVLKPKTGSTVLAVHHGERNHFGSIPLITVAFPGSGRVLMCAFDSVWRWRKGVEDKYHYRFWGQVVRWMSHKRHQSNHKDIRIMMTPEKPLKGQLVDLKVILYDEAGYPLDVDELNLIIKSKHLSQEFRFETEANMSGIYYTQFKTDMSGEYILKISDALSNINYEERLLVEPSFNEKIGLAAQENHLRTLSKVSGGKFGNLKRIEELISEIKALPEKETRKERILIWSHWLIGLVIIALSGSFWILRKRAGLV